MSTTRIQQAGFRDYDVFVDGRYIGSTPDLDSARSKADTYRLNQLHHQPPTLIYPYVVLDGRLLGFVFSVAQLTEQSVTLAICQQHLTVAAGNDCLLHSTSVICHEGNGHATIRLESEQFAELRHSIRSQAIRLPQIRLYIAHRASCLVLAADEFVAQANGTLLDHYQEHAP